MEILLHIAGLLLACTLITANESQLTLLGRVTERDQSVAYYYRAEPQVDWETAKSVCESEGKRLATVSSFNQTMMVVNKIGEIVTLANKTSNSVWTAGRENLVASGYRWDDNTPWDITVLGKWMHFRCLPYVICVELAVTPHTGEHWFAARRCRSRRSVLCKEVAYAG